MKMEPHRPQLVVELEDLIREKKLIVTVNYFGSKYKGVATGYTVLSDGSIQITAIDPRMVEKEKGWDV